jgi:aspartate/methionine/tyrosine aminotransferase
MPPLSKFAQSVEGSTVVGMRRQADALEAKGMRVIDFGIGEPDFEAPPPVREAAIKAIRDGHGNYIDPRGLLELREVIAVFEAERHGLTVDPEQIVVTPGSYGGLSLITRALLDPEDQVLVLEPCWGPYKAITKLVGAEPVGVPMGVVDGRFVIDGDRIEAAVTPKTRAIILNSPWNPTGRVLLEPELTGIAAVAERHDLWIIADEVYSELIYGNARHVSIARLGPEIAARTVIATSLSKSFAMTGWRLGYCIAPPELAALLARLNLYSSRCATSIVQHAGSNAGSMGRQQSRRRLSAGKCRRAGDAGFVLRPRQPSSSAIFVRDVSGAHHRRGRAHAGSIAAAWRAFPKWIVPWQPRRGFSAHWICSRPLTR